jgi:2-C-methyl-D-erythritol 4-phosphate cytidylyltransferase
MATAVLLAAGSGERFSGETSKQMAHLAGSTVLEYSLNAFEKNQEIQTIVLVTSQSLISDVKQLVGQKFKKVSQIIQGGATRSDSSSAALNTIVAGPQEKVLIHDAARPLVSQGIINSCINALDHNEAVVTALPSTDTILEVEEGNVISVPKREYLWRAQTPQGFQLGVIKNAYELLGRVTDDDEFVPTDDCSVLLHFSPKSRLAVVYGSETNIKITYPADLSLAETFIHLNTL